MLLFSAIAFLLCLAFIPIVQGIALHKGWVAYPQKDRWHRRPTVAIGGIAIYSAVIVPIFLLTDFMPILPKIITPLENHPLPPIGAVICIGMTLLFILGLIDDFKHIKPQTKLVGQILTASVIAFLGFRLHWFISLTLDTVVTIFWIVGITNAFNLIDNMDGLCAGIGLIAALYLAFLFNGNSTQSAIIAMIFSGALLAFLFFNFNPATIFMGDCGSLVIGFVLAMLCLHYSETATNTLASYAVPVMVLMVPVLDTTMVTVIRLLSGRKASIGGKDHTSHRLVVMGFSERGAVMFLYGVGAISGIAAVFVSKTDTLTSPAVIIPLLFSIILMGIYLAQLRIYPEKEFSMLRDRSYTPVLMELTYRRQIMLVVLDFCIIIFSYYLSYRLRFDSDAFPFYFKRFLHSLPAVIACKFIAFFVIGVYRGFWQYMSTSDVFVYMKASTLATLLSVAAVTYIYRFLDFSKGIFLIDWLLTTGLLLGTRGSFRISFDSMKRKTLSGATVLIYGAGRGGELMLREILNNGNHKIKPVGFIDDDTLKIGKKLQGYPILGSFQDIEALCRKHNVTGLLISFNNHNPQRIETIKTCCKKNNLFLKQFSIAIRNIDLEDSRH